MTRLAPEDVALQVRDLRLDPRSRTVRRAGEVVALCPVEYELLRAMMARPGQVVSRAALEVRLRSLGRMTHGAAVTVHIHHLRRKIGGERIRTVRGIGYLLPRDAQRW